MEKQTIRNIVFNLVNGRDYRIEVITLINAVFLQFAIDFFKKVAEAKLNNQNINTDWYKKEMLSLELPSEDIAINSGLNKKTITNMYNSAAREVVIDASNRNYDSLCSAINELTNTNDLNLSLQIRFNKVSIELDISESLIVINTLAVKRAALRGGLWSAAGKQVEHPLMLTLCRLFNVPDTNYSTRPGTKKSGGEIYDREVDFYLLRNSNEYKCEVKLMGKGNPESADAAFARDSRVFIADKLSDRSKAQLDQHNVKWVELRNRTGYKKFATVLRELKIPCQAVKKADVNAKIEKILLEVLEESRDSG